MFRKEKEKEKAQALTAGGGKMERTAQRTLPESGTLSIASATEKVEATSLALPRLGYY